MAIWESSALPENTLGRETPGLVQCDYAGKAPYLNGDGVVDIYGSNGHNGLMKMWERTVSTAANEDTPLPL